MSRFFMMRFLPVVTNRYAPDRLVKMPSTGAFWRAFGALQSPTDKALRRLAGCLALALVMLALGCAAQPPVTRPNAPVLTSACVRSFLPTLRAWEARFGRAPDKCSRLDMEYRVHLVSASELAHAGCDCVCSSSGQLVGCTTQPDRAIYLLDGRSQVETTDTSAHEWIHATEQCVRGDMDVDHARSGLWERNDGAESVEIQAQASAAIGDCL